MLKRMATVLASCFIVLAAQAQLKITGTITDETGIPLGGANVWISRSTDGVISAADGSYVLSGLLPGRYEVTASYLGFARKTVAMDLSASSKVDFVLEPEIVMAEEVTVRATRAGRNAPVAQTFLGREEIAPLPKIQDITYLISTTPSVTLTSDGGTGVGYSGIRIRGTDPTRINVTLNGMPFNDSESHEVYWVDIPDILASTENIQVQRGVGTSTQGAAAFGANINLQTTSVNSEPHALVSLGGGSFNTIRSSLSAGTGLIRGKWNFDARLSRIHTDGFIDRAFADLSSVALSGGLFTRNNILKVTLLSGSELTYQAWGGVPRELLETNRTFNPYTYENEVDNYRQQHAFVQWTRQWTSRFDLNVSLHYTRGKGYYEQYRDGEDLAGYGLDPVVLGQDTVSESDLVRRKWLDNHFFGTVYAGHWAFSRLNLTVGGGLSQYLGDHYGKVIWARFASGSQPDHLYYLNKGDKGEINQFVKADVKLADDITIFADMQGRFIRYEINGQDDDLRDITQSHRYAFFNPKAGINWEFAKNHRAYASYGLAGREPKRSNFTDAAPGMEVRPEFLRDLEIGWAWNTGALTSGINLYWMDYTDQLVLTGQINDVGAPVMVNIPDSYRAGMELTFGWQPVKWIRLDANATVSRNQILNFTEYVDDWDTGVQRAEEIGTAPISFSPALTTFTRITINPVKDLSISLDNRTVSRQYADNTGNIQRSLDPYAVTNLNFSWEMHPRGFQSLSWFVQVNNLFNVKYETNAWIYSYYYNGTRQELNGYFPQAGIHFYTGLTARF